MRLIQIYLAITMLRLARYCLRTAGRSSRPPQTPPAFIVGGFLVCTKPVKMLQHGYNESEVPPFHYEGNVHMTTIALRGVTVLSQRTATASQVFRDQTVNSGGPAAPPCGPPGDSDTFVDGNA